MFPVFIPETLTSLTVWKRYNDVKKLRKQIVNRHKELHLRGTVPEHSDEGFFRRFDPDVIQSRREYILRLLDFIAQHPALYKCHAFVQFFEASQSPGISPMKRRPSNIATICGEIEVPFSAEYKLIDPERDKDQSDTDDDEVMTPTTSNNISSSSPTSSDTTSTCSEAGSRTSGAGDEVECATEAAPDEVDHVASNYIYEAALEFSDAVRAEVGHHYRKAFDAYKRGIAKLIEGARTDVRAQQRRVAKDKIQKYLARAEQIHDCYLAKDEVDGTDVARQSKPNGGVATSRDSLEMPLAELSRYKVLKVVHGVMQVQDMTDGRIYIMKVCNRLLFKTFNNYNM